MSNTVLERPLFQETDLLLTMKRWTAEECDALAEQGYLPERYQLIEGIIVEDMRTSALHSMLVGLLLDVFAPLFGTSRIRIEGTIRLSEEATQRNQLVSDMTITREERRAYRENPLPQDLLLVVEVADSRLRSDLKIKANLYAEAGIVEYWVVDAGGKRVVVHREPTPQGYQSITEWGEGASVFTLALPTKPIEVSALLQSHN